MKDLDCVTYLHILSYLGGGLLLAMLLQNLHVSPLRFLGLQTVQWDAGHLTWTLRSRHTALWGLVRIFIVVGAHANSNNQSPSKILVPVGLADVYLLAMIFVFLRGLF